MGNIYVFFADEPRKMQIAVFLIFIFIFCDAGYLLYFNSLYGEPLQYVSLMILIALGLLIYKRPTIPKIACFFVALYFFRRFKTCECAVFGYSFGACTFLHICVRASFTE